jgi:hypothetical protein
MNLNAANAFFFHELIHLLITVLISFFIWRRFRDFRLILVVFLFGIFIDIDHWFDYFAHFGLTVNFKNFFNVASYAHQSGKVYIPFHGWEFIIIFWLIGRWLGKIFKMKGMEWAITISYLAHLLWDNFSFSHNPLAYSFLFRLVNNFSLKSFSGL